MSTLVEIAPNPRLAYRVWRRNFRVFGKLWKGSLAPQFIDPVFYLLAMGFGLGKYLSTVDGIPYKSFVGTGLIASAVMWAASFETTWNIYFRMQETRLYDAILTSSWTRKLAGSGQRWSMPSAISTHSACRRSASR